MPIENVKSDGIVERTVDVLARQLELRHFRYFVAVAEELNFHRAAERLHISQPPLTAQIQQLERILGMQLFERSKQRVLLTAAGRELLGHALRILASVADTPGKLMGVQSGAVGELRIGYTESAIYLGFILETIQRFRLQRPGVSLRLFPLKSMVQLAALDRGELDIGFVWTLPDRLSTLLEFDRLWEEPLVVALPQACSAERETGELSLADLANQPFITISRDSGTLFFRTITALCRSAGFTPAIAYETSDLATVLGLVASGAGVAIVPAAMKRLRIPGVVYRSLSNDIHRIDMHWVSRKNSTIPLLHAMRKAMFETVRSAPRQTSDTRATGISAHGS